MQIVSRVNDLFTIVPGMAAIFLVGPTASGKSAVGLELARRLGREVVSADSMQVYRGMDIGTAKIKGQHLVDVSDVTEPFDVRRYLELAGPLLPNALVVGGTGLYIRALRQGLFEGPGRDEQLRKGLEALPAIELFAELKRMDPKAAKDIDSKNPRRLVRALEVFHATGKSIRDFQNEKPTHDLVFGLNREREDLYRRIEQRIDEQLAAGWVEEVRRLMGRGLEQNKTAMQAAGYRELVAHIRGQLALPETVALIKTRTRQLARRQLTWFRREPGLTWIDVRPDEPPTETARRIFSRIEAESDETRRGEGPANV
jgi:tRNA dimethylallyltransferase